MTRSIVVAGVVLALMVSACGSGAAPPTAVPSSAQAAAVPSAAVVPSSAPATKEPTTAPTSVVCEFYTGPAHQDIVDAATAGMSGGNEAIPLRKAINAIKAIAAHAQDPTEKKDLTTFADALDAAALSGAGFDVWDASFEAFIAKYAEQCGQPLAT